VTASYLAVMRVRPARRLLYALTAACLSFGMVGLTLLLTVERLTGSYADGGFAVSLFALAAGGSAPVRGRLVDRRGARRWLPGLAAAYAVSLCTIDLLARLDGPLWSLLVLAACVGASTPPLFSSARAVWPQAVEPHLLRRGYALTSLLADAGQVAGPALASVLFLVSSWIAPLLCAAAALLGAALSVPARDPGNPPRRPKPMPGLFSSRALLALLGTSILFGTSVGLVQVSVPTLAGRWHESSLGGPLLAAFALGSVLGALWFGTRHWRRAVIERYLLAVLALGVLLAPIALAGSPAGLAPLLLIAGLAFGPATVSMFESLDALAPGTGTEALTWVTTAEASGTAVGAAGAGVLATHAAASTPFLLASMLLVVPIGLALLIRTRGRRGSVTSGPTRIQALERARPNPARGSE
jgi:predicted MFS family arabinose efflux permease